jgi:ribosomal protein L23
MLDNKQVAKEIRKYFKDNKITGSVRISSVHTVYVDADLKKYSVEIEKLRNDLKKYIIGSFNGEFDGFQYTSRNENLPQTKYLIIQSTINR